MSARLVVSALTLSVCLAAEAIGAPIELSDEKTALDRYIRHLVVDDFDAQVDDVLSNLGEFKVCQKGFPIWDSRRMLTGFWLRLRIRATQVTLSLKINMRRLTNWMCFLLRGSEVLESAKGGEVRPFEKRSYEHRNTNIEFKLLEAQTYRLLVRVVSESSIQLPLVVFKKEAYLSHMLSESAVFYFYYGLMFVMFCYNLLLFISTRDRVYLPYLLYLLAYIGFQASMNGYAKLWLFNDEGQLVNRFLLITNYLAGLGCYEFINRFLRADMIGQRWRSIFKWMIRVFALLAFCSTFMPYSIMVIGCAAWGALTPWILFYLGYRAVSRGAPGAGYFTIAWLCPLIGTVLLSLNVSGILDAGFMSAYAIQIGSALQVILLSLAIGQKFKIAQEERDASQKALLETYQQLDQELLNREKLLASNRQLSEDNRIASEQLIQADKLATMGTMVAGVAHDIASPTTLIGLSREEVLELIERNDGLLEACFQDTGDEETQEVYLEFKRYSDGIKAALTKIDLGVNRVHSINNAIRNQSRNDQAASMETLKSVVEECLVVVGSRLRLLEVDVRIDPALQMEMVRSQFGQVIMNLLANAADAVEAHLDKQELNRKGEVCISARAVDGKFEMTIEDSGPGIPVELRSKILEPFLRLSRLERELV